MHSPRVMSAFVAANLKKPPIPPLNPATLLPGNKLGARFDLTDKATLFQNVSGTQPVTAVGQPVALILDKAYNLTYGAEQTPAHVSGLFAANATAEALTQTPAGTLTTAWFPITGNRYYRIFATNCNRYRIQTKAANGVITYDTQSLDSSPDQRVYRSPATAVQMRIHFRSETQTGTSALVVKEFPGIHLFQTTTARWPTYQEDSQGHGYLQFDGIDDCYATLPFDLTSASALSIIAIGRKEQDDAIAILVEHSTNPNNFPATFYIGAPSRANDKNMGFLSKGNGTAGHSPIFFNVAAPLMFCALFVSDLRASFSRFRMNGGEMIRSRTNSDLNGGTLGNYPLFVGRRNQSQYAYKGRLYELSLYGFAIGPDDLEGVEKYLNQKYGIF